MAGTEPNFPLNAPQPNLLGHVVAIRRFDISHCIDISYSSGIIRLNPNFFCLKLLHRDSRPNQIAFSLR